MKVLLVKLTSMGDLIHALPAITDAVRAIPGIQFDWVADEAFADIPLLHPAVNRVIKTAHRRWSKAKWRTVKSGELKQLWRELRTQRYDIILDSQNNLKSAVIMRLARGLRCGVDQKSGREWGAHLACQKTVKVLFEQHATDRQREIFAKVLGYEKPQTTPDFGIDLNRLPALAFELPKPYLVFVHSTTWDTKHWPERYWYELIKIATDAGYHVVLPWGNAKEQERAQRLAQSAVDHTTVLPRLRIPEQASVLAQAAGAVCVDTGLGHLAAALGTPAVHLYGPTDPALIGATGQHQLHLTAPYPCAPCYLHHCKFGPESECFINQLPPKVVWERFLSQLK